jgi:SAM-dependent methyltransferase
MTYYKNKIGSLRRIFATEDIVLTDKFVVVKGRPYPLVDDVIVLLDPSQYTEYIRKFISPGESVGSDDIEAFSKPVQSSFGQQWIQYSNILDEHCIEFEQYFDLVEMDSLQGQSVCDLGCGIGRWSFFLQKLCREMILVDFSDAIFVARKNLAHSDNALFFMGDLKRLPFADNFCDFLFSLGVLHHLPSNALDEVRQLKKYAPQILIYLYYALDNRPFHFRVLYWAMELGRRVISSLKTDVVRQALIWGITLFVYLPFIGLGRVLKPLGLEKQVPLYEFYNGKSIGRIRQDVHDRFVTSIEHRYSRDQIMELRDSYSRVDISDRIPYWHFLCTR